MQNYLSAINKKPRKDGGNIPGFYLILRSVTSSILSLSSLFSFLSAVIFPE